MANKSNDKTQEKKEIILLPEGRLINEAVFEKDAFTNAQGKEATPKYKVEVAFDPAALTGEGTVEDKLIDAAIKEWGAAAEDWFFGEDADGKPTKRTIRSPLLDGDFLAEKREDKGKQGDAYKGTLVIRADTAFNKNGQDAAGGITVLGPDAKEIGPANRQEIYPGCYVKVAVTIGAYEDNEGKPGLKFYLCAVQKTRDGEKLFTGNDYSKLFAPAGGGSAGEGSPRRRSR